MFKLFENPCMACLASLSMQSILVGAVQAQLVATTLQEAAADRDFQVQGEYAGSERAVQVVAMGDGEFRCVLYQAGLPGAGWDRSPPRILELDTDGVEEFVSANSMKKIKRTSPTLNLRPPSGAIVLFDETDQSIQQHWQPGAKKTDAGHLQQGCTSLDTFQDFTIHIEFQTPYMPNARGQGRGNSGIYYQGRYETQVLDSFGLTGQMNETGGIYSIRAPDLNMCLPPLSWQTYDVDFQAAKFDESGNKIEDARITVRLNGVVVQQNVSLTHATTAAPMKEGAEPGPIYIQDHGNPVRFRNIWVLPRDLEKENRRPKVLGFERFFADSGAHQFALPSLGGQTLIGELGCTNCHAAPEQLNRSIAPKPSPILDEVGNRIRPDYLRNYILDPHGVRPGSTMPDVLSRLEPEQRSEVADAIASYLSSKGQLTDRLGNPKSAARGKELYHQVGCVACHAPQDGSSAPLRTSIDLHGIEHKYTLDSLAEFLQEPHAIRPGGRMPQLVTGKDASDVATYLLRDVVVGDSIFNARVQFYRGVWEKLPDFDQLEPVETKEVYGLDIKAVGRNLNRFGARFESYLVIPRTGTYQFRLGSDDGSRLWINGQLLIENDGIHGVTWREAQLELEQGRYPLRVDFFEKDGGEELHVEISGGGLDRMPIESMLSLNREEVEPEPLRENFFAPRPELIAKGSEYFVSLGCASCHQVEGRRPVATAQHRGPPLLEVDPSRGCLAEEMKPKLPDYELTELQKTRIRTAITDLASQPDLTNQQLIQSRMLTLNCYACHSRKAIGGVEFARNDLFHTTMKEMGDEGRLPPPLDGVGDKLKPEYLKRTLKSGAQERDYMRTQMPGFGTHLTDKLADLLVAADQRTAADIPPPLDTPENMESAGRLLAGNKGLACIKCHTARGQGTGIRAMDMFRMTERLRRDWFHRYLISPTTYRPGTRMPASFPDRKSVLPDLFRGDPDSQLSALWAYLGSGSDARLPIGAEPRLIELVANERPVIYRNFIEGLSPRGIGVGFPEGLNIAWDANSMSLAKSWKGAFVDASRHWIGRGQGRQGPLGDQEITLDTGAPIAVLDSLQDAWPTEPARERGYRFLGYQLNPKGQPTFVYRLGQVTVEDELVPIENAGQPRLQRTLTITGSAPNLVLRLAVAQSIAEASDRTFVIDNRYSSRVSGGLPRQVQIGGQMELRLPLDSNAEEHVIKQLITW